MSDIIGDFWRDGAVCVRNAFDEMEVARFEAAIAAVLAAPSPLGIRASREDDGLFFEDFCNADRIEEVHAAVHGTSAAGLAHQIMGGETTRFYHDHVLVKEAGTAQRTPWHQDLPYYNVDGRLNVSLWIPVDRVPAETSLRFIAGSHRGPWYLPRTFAEGDAKWFPEGTLEELPGEDQIATLGEVLQWELEPGDAVAFHMLTVHSAAGTAERRRVLSLRFLGEDMVFAERPWRTSPPFEGVQVRTGQPVRGEQFPVMAGMP